MKTPNQVHHHHLIQYTPPSKNIRTCTDLIVFDKNYTADERHSITNDPKQFQICRIPLKEHEKIIILKMSILYSLSDFDQPAFFETCPMFEIDYENEENFGKKHPDFTGCAEFIIPGRYNGPIAKEERLIYEPNLINLKGMHILQYAGMEGHIMNARSTCVPSETNSEYMCFVYTDPLIVFLMNHKQHFDEVRRDDIIITQNETQGPIYMVRKAIVERVQRFFANAIFPHIRYSTNNAIYFRWAHGKPLPSTSSTSANPIMSFMVELDYVIISPQITTYQVQGIKLNF